MKRICLYLLIFCALVCVLFIVFVFSIRPPREKKLISNFYANRKAYERLRDMCCSGKDKEKETETQNDYEQYEKENAALLKQVGGIRAPSFHGDPCILTWASGFGGDTRHIEICWLDTPPANQVASLDDFYKTPKPRSPVFRHIEDNWYLWADW